MALSSRFKYYCVQVGVELLELKSKLVELFIFMMQVDNISLACLMVLHINHLLPYSFFPHCFLIMLLILILSPYDPLAPPPGASPAP
jgi:hypothetical protein